MRRAGVFLGWRLLLENMSRLFSPEVESFMFLIGISNWNMIANTCGLLVCVLNQAFLINNPIPN